MADEQSEQSDEELELFSQYYEGALEPEARASLERRLEADEKLRSSYEAFKATMRALTGMRDTAAAPPDFGEKVEETIHRRSGGRFFGRKAFGDRIPYELLAVVVMLVAGLIYWLSRTSGTGRPKYETGGDEVQEAPQDVVPRD